MKDKYQYILFDWDGCLAKTLNIWLDSYKEVFNKHNIFPTDLEIVTCFGNWNGPENFGISNGKDFVDEVKIIGLSKINKVELYPHAKSLLSLLRNKKTALLSSSPKEAIRKALKYNNLSSYFDVILTAEDVTNHKPHPEMLETGIKLLGGNKKETIMIGDSEKDLGAANNAGISSMLYFPKDHGVFYNFSELKSFKPTFIISDFKEAIPILN